MPDYEESPAGRLKTHFTFEMDTFQIQDDALLSPEIHNGIKRDTEAWSSVYNLCIYKNVDK